MEFELIDIDATATITIVGKGALWIAGVYTLPGAVVTVPRIHALDLVRRGRATING